MPRFLAFLVLASLSSGCAFFSGAQESDEEGDYAGGPGVMFVLRNEAGGPVDFEVDALDPRGHVVAGGNGTLEPNGTAVRKYGLAAAGLYTGRLVYNWERDARAAAGTNEQSFRVADCPTLTRIEWRVLLQGEEIASQLVDIRCEG